MGYPRGWRLTSSAWVTSTTEPIPSGQHFSGYQVFISEFTLSRSPGGSRVMRLLALNKAQVFPKINMVVRSRWYSVYPALKGLFWGSRYACPVLGSQEKTIRSINPTRMDWGHRYCAVLCVLDPAFFIVTPATAQYSSIRNTDFIYRA